MRVIFMGTPDLAAICLGALSASRHQVALVVTQPDRPAGRSGTPQPPAVKVTAEAGGLPVIQPPTLTGDEVRAQLRATEAELGVVVAYGRMLGPKMLATLPRGFVNVHTSLLPRWRGASPIQAAIRAGDPTTGVTLMQMDAGLDTGPILTWREVAVAERETATTLHDRLAVLAARLLVEGLDRLERDELTPLPQSASPFGPPTTCRTLTKDDGRIDWGEGAVVIDRLVRAMTPWPGAFTTLAGERLLIHDARPALDEAARAPAAPGTIAVEGDRLFVACGAGHLELLVVQRAGRRAAPVAEFLRGLRLAPGDRCGSRPG